MVQTNESIYGKHRAFTSSQQNLVLPGAKSKYLEAISVTINGLQNGSTATTIANALGLVNPLEVDVGGIPQIRVRLADMYAMDMLWLQHNPLTKISGGDNQEWICNQIVYPCWFPPSRAEATLTATYAAVTNADNTEVSITSEYLDGIPRNEALYYSEFSKNTDGVDSSSFGNWTQTTNLVGNMTGMLFNSPTIPGGSTLMEDGTIQQVRIQGNGNTLLVYEWSEIQNPGIFNGQMFNALEESPATTGILDNYRWLSLAKEPIPAGTRVQTDIMAGVDSSAIRTVQVQQVPFRGR